jgi:hypothetical protein
MSRQRRLASRVVVSLVLFSLAVPALAKVEGVTLKGLAARSDLIVFARVTKIEAGPNGVRPAGDESRPVKVATAQVIETWKGDEVREVRYIASPTWACDTASAAVGERVVLFLEGSREKSYSIAHAGRGRMPIHELNDTRYAELADEVILPEGTPTVARTKTARVTLQAKAKGQPERSESFTYQEWSIELDRLRKLIKANSHAGQPPPP